MKAKMCVITKYSKHAYEACAKFTNGNFAMCAMENEILYDSCKFTESFHLFGIFVLLSYKFE